MTEGDVRRIVEDQMEEYFEYKPCPKCGKNMRMLKFDVWDEDGGEYFKCLYCGALLREKMEEVQQEVVKPFTDGD